MWWGRLLWLLYPAAVQQDPGGGLDVERELLERLPVGSDEATAAALAALRCGGSYDVWDGTTSAESIALCRLSCRFVGRGSE